MNNAMELKTFPDDLLKKLDFPTILEKLENLCRGSLGVEQIQEQTFSSDPQWIQIAVKQVVEMKDILINEPNFPENGFDTLPFLGKISIQGAALAEFERNIIRERTNAGLAAARARGRKGGRKLALNDKQVREIKLLLSDPENQVTEVAKRYGVSRATIYKYLAAKAE